MVANISSRATQRRIVQSVRGGQANSMNFASLAEIRFEEEQLMLDGESILVHDSGYDDPQRFLIFGASSAMNLYRQADLIQADGTFKIVPLLFSQLYVIHARVQKIIVPVFYVLMPRRTQVLYERVFQKIAEIASASPRLVLTDFEMAAINAYGTTIPQSPRQGCYYHMQEANYANLQQIDIETTNGTQKMSVLYESNAEFAIDIRLLGSLAFVPLRDLYAVFDEVVAYLQAKYGNKVVEYIGYFQSTYIGNVVGANRAAPLFSPEFWNLFQRVLDNDPLTNNAVEGHNNALRLSSPGHHLTIQRFLKLMMKDITSTKLAINEYLGGTSPQKKRKKYRELTKRVRQIVGTYDLHQNKVMYLKYLSQIFAM